MIFKKTFHFYLILVFILNFFIFSGYNLTQALICGLIAALIVLVISLIFLYIRYRRERQLSREFSVMAHKANFQKGALNSDNIFTELKPLSPNKHAFTN